MSLTPMPTPEVVRPGSSTRKPPRAQAGEHDAVFREFLSRLPEVPADLGVGGGAFKAIRVDAIASEANLAIVEEWVTQQGGSRRTVQVPDRTKEGTHYKMCDHLLVPLDALTGTES